MLNTSGQPTSQPFDPTRSITASTAARVKSHGLSRGLIAGISIGTSVISILVILVIVGFVLRRRKTKSASYIPEYSNEVQKSFPDYAILNSPPSYDPRASNPASQRISFTFKPEIPTQDCDTGSQHYRTGSLVDDASTITYPVNARMSNYQDVGMGAELDGEDGEEVDVTYGEAQIGQRKTTAGVDYRISHSPRSGP